MELRKIFNQKVPILFKSLERIQYKILNMFKSPGGPDSKLIEILSNAIK